MDSHPNEVINFGPLNSHIRLPHACLATAKIILPQSATATRFVWNRAVLGRNKAQVIAKAPKAMLVYLKIIISLYRSCGTPELTKHISDSRHKPTVIPLTQRQS